MKIRLIYSVQHMPYGLKYHIYDFNLHLRSPLIENGFQQSASYATDGTAAT